MRDFDKTIISQYSSSPRLTQLIQSINSWLDPGENLERFYNLIWNIDTAEGYGLDVWGRIVGINRVISFTQSGPFFGFQEAGDRTGFNQGPFYSPQGTTTNFTLNDESYRLLILAKAAANITDCSIPAINAILMNLFPNRGNAYVTDGREGVSGVCFGFQEAGDRTGFNQATFSESLGPLPAGMTMTYVFNFVLQPFEIAIVTQSGVLPKPTGVKASASYYT